MTEDDIEILERATVYRGFHHVERLKLRHRLHAGGWSDALERELVQRGPAAAVLPYDPRRDEVVLIQQFRVGAFGAGHGPWLTELVAGMIPDGESAEQTVRREAREEAGLEIGELLPISRQLSSPGAYSETVAIFCGRTDATGAGGVHGLPEEQEDIRAVLLSAADAFALRRAGREIFDSTTVTALLWLELEREGLRRRWR
jgi:ADP-ribose pyrophosphatase